MPWLRAGVLATIVGCCLLVQAAQGQAYDPLDPDREILQRKGSTAAMSESVYRKLSVVNEHFAEEDYPAALEGLDALAARSLSDYERALVLQTYGFIGAMQGENDKAIDYFERCLALEALGSDAQQGMLYSLATLYGSRREFQKVIDTLLQWYPYEPSPSPESYMLMAASFLELDNLSRALAYVRQAIAMADEPRESWYQTELGILFEQQDYAGAAEVLRVMVARWPDELRYWEMLSGAYMEQGEDDLALAALMLAWHRDLVVEEKKILNLARFNLYREEPYVAATLLEASMEAGQVQTSQDNLQLLLSAWTAAREMDQALATIDRLAPMAEDGRYYMYKARLLNEQGRWEGVVTAARQAIDKGDLTSDGDAWILMGVAWTELKNYDQAMDAFQNARASDDSNARRDAESWIAYVRDRRGAAGG